jgi:hypothetical protein
MVRIKLGPNYGRDMSDVPYIPAHPGLSYLFRIYAYDEISYAYAPPDFFVCSASYEPSFT